MESKLDVMREIWVRVLSDTSLNQRILLITPNLQQVECYDFHQGPKCASRSFLSVPCITECFTD